MKNTVSFCGRTPPPASPDLSTYLHPLLILPMDREDLCVRMGRIMGYVTGDVVILKDFFPKRVLFLRKINTIIFTKMMEK